MGSIRILIADDHPLIRAGLRTLLSHEPGFVVVAEACDGQEAAQAAQREFPDVAILDIGMPNLNGIEAARRIAGSVPNVQLVMLTIHADESYLLSALRAGARGYVLKSSIESEVIDAVRAVSQGHAFFSPWVSRILADRLRVRHDLSSGGGYELLTGRERQILQLLAEGQSNKDIAHLLDLSPPTVVSHRQHVFQKLNLRNLSDLILYAVRSGVISPPRGGV